MTAHSGFRRREATARSTVMPTAIDHWDHYGHDAGRVTVSNAHAAHEKPDDQAERERDRVADQDASTLTTVPRQKTTPRPRLPLREGPGKR